MSRYLCFSLGALFSTIIFFLSPSKALNDAPMKVISSMVEESFDLLRKTCATGQPIKSKRDEIYRLALKYVDMDEVSPRIVGPVWKEQTRESQEEFKKLFRDMIFTSYIDKLETYACEEKRVLYDGEEVQGNIARVKTRIHSQGHGEVSVEYRLKNKGSGWKIYDVVIEGVSMVQNYRSQFSSILQRQSFAQMLDMLRNKVGSP
ncbi:MAG: ABC transporter substrate-binding protein [Syntrophobacterales bacterium]|nr:ABC transporter substrate-binding protein [Syntrophobacterales bacterium]